MSPDDRLTEAVVRTLRHGESPLIAADDAPDFIVALLERHAVISNAEGYIVEKDFDVLQNDLVLRYDKRLHEQEQPERSVAEAAADFMLRAIEGARTVDRKLHFKFFV